MLPKGGHAPGHLREMLLDSIEYETADEKWWTYFATDEADGAIYGRERGEWEKLDAKGRARWLTARLWNTTDIVPQETLETLDLEPGMTYAQVVRRLRKEIEDNPATNGRPPLFGETMVLLHTYVPAPLMESLNRRCNERGIRKADGVREALATWVTQGAALSGSP